MLQLNVSTPEALGMELMFSSDNSQVLVSSVEKSSQAQVGYPTRVLTFFTFFEFAWVYIILRVQIGTENKCKKNFF